MMQTQKTLENQQSLMQSGQISGSLSFNGTMTKEDEEMSKSALSTFRAKEEEIEKKKMEVKEKVQAQLGRIEEETKRLSTIREVPLSLSLSVFFFFFWVYYALISRNIWDKKSEILVLAFVSDLCMGKDAPHTFLWSLFC